MPGNMVERKITYNTETIEAASSEVNNGLLGIRKASEKYGIPKSTLGDRITGMLIKDKIFIFHSMFVLITTLFKFQSSAPITQLFYQRKRRLFWELENMFCFLSL